LFRIDRRNVNLAGIKVLRHKIDSDDDDNDDNPEVEAEEDFLPDAKTSAEALVNEYMSTAEKEMQQKAEAILEQARDQAATIIFQAREDAEEQHQKAWQEGFEEGTRKGKLAYDEKTEAKIQEDDEMLKRVLDEIYQEREKLYNELEDETTNLAIEIVKKIFNPAEEELENVFISLIKNALRQMSTDNKILIRVSPVEYERYFSSGAAEIELDSGAVVKAAVLRDVSLNEGDCIIDADDVTVNAGLDSQLQYVQLAFERANQYEPE